MLERGLAAEVRGIPLVGTKQCNSAQHNRSTGCRQRCSLLCSSLVCYLMTNTFGCYVQPVAISEVSAILKRCVTLGAGCAGVSAADRAAAGHLALP